MVSSYYVSKKRLLSLALTAIFIFLCIFSRLFYIQIVWGSTLQYRAVDQWTRDLPIVALRGDIVDATGRTLVSSYYKYTVYVRAKSVTDPEKVAEVLSKYLDVNYETVFTKATKRNISESTIKRQVDLATVNKIREFNLAGVYFGAESSRQYVYGDFLSQVLGFVSIDNKGQTGLEAYYDKYLSGIDGALLTQADLVGVELTDEQMYYIGAVKGLEVELTIDYVIQSAVENVLNVMMQAHTPKNAKCIVLDVTNGEILAMGSRPSYNLNDIPRDNVSLLMEYSRNTLLTDVYEPGSTFKVLTAAASLQEAANGNPNGFDANYIFRNNSNTRYIDGSKISCWTKHLNGKHCNQNLQMALNNSCNPIFTDIALSLGKETMYKYLSSFGYGQLTGIDYIGEQAGILVSENSVTNGDLARIGFGQTIAVTPLQLIMATAAAVNGGKLYQPYFVKQITDPTTGKVVKTTLPTIKSQPIDQSTSKLIAQMLQGVVTNGSGKQAYIEGYEVGGKTGTAQKYANGSIAVGKYVSSFVGFFPASSPKYMALMIVDEPVGASYGSIVAAPYAKTIFQTIIDYYDIAPLS